MVSSRASRFSSRAGTLPRFSLRELFSKLYDGRERVYAAIFVGTTCEAVLRSFRLINQAAKRWGASSHAPSLSDQLILQYAKSIAFWSSGMTRCCAAILQLSESESTVKFGCLQSMSSAWIDCGLSMK